MNRLINQIPNRLSPINLYNKSKTLLLIASCLFLTNSQQTHTFISKVFKNAFLPGKQN